MTVLYSTHQTTIGQLGQYIGQAVKALYAEAAKNEVLVAGPAYWIYYGMDGHPDTVFTLEIAIPIQGKIVDSRFATRELAPFKAACHVHEAAWSRMSDAYAQLMQFIASKNLGMTGECRELYLNIDFEHPENNLTEIQVGISGHIN